jgi:flagellar biosynthetic protein FliR
MVIPVELAGGALALARVLGLCATAPLLGAPELPRGVRLGFALLVSAALTPLRIEGLPALGLTPSTGAGADAALALGVALAAELALGLAVGLAARFTLAAVEVAGHLGSTSLGLSFAEQYDPHVGAADIGRLIARTLAAVAFLAAGGLEALVAAAAQPLPLAPAAAAASLAAAATAALRCATDATALGLGVAAPLVLAALVANLAVSLAHRAAAAINIFTVGFAASLLAVCAAALVTAPRMIAGVHAVADRAVALLAPGGAP